MGYTTTINFLNDSYESIRSNPEEVVNNILDAMSNTNVKCKTYGVGNFANPMTATKSVHADTPQLYISYGNSFVALGYNNDINSIDVRKKFLKIAKSIIKEEETMVKKIEGKTEIDVFDLDFYTNKVKTFGRYKVQLSKSENPKEWNIYEDNMVVFIGSSNEVVRFINAEIKK
jgi:hypothetical protein